MKKIILLFISIIGINIGATNIKIMTYNLWMLPYQDLAKTKLLKQIAALLGKGEKIEDLDTDAQGRAAKIAAVIAALADVFAFEEAFDSAGRKILRAGMKKAGVSYSTKVLGRPAIISRRLTNSGLFTMSKYPIAKSTGIYYKDSFKTKKRTSKGIGTFLFDGSADKGVLYVKIIKDGKPFHIFSTHTQAKTTKKQETPPAGALIRERQWKRIRAFIDSLNIPKSEPVIIVGDMNVDKANPQTRADRYAEYKKMLEILNASELPLKPGSYPYTSLFDPESVAKNQIPGQWIDYVLFANTHLKPTKAEAYVPVKNEQDAKKWEELSDHFPLIGSFEFAGY